MMPQSTYSQNPGSRFLLTTAAFIIVVAGMRAAETILVPLIVAVFLAIISTSAVFWLRQHKIPAPLAVIFVVLGVLGVGFGLILIIGTSLDDFSEAIPHYQSRLTQEILPLIHWIQGLGFELDKEIILESIDPGASMRLVAKMLAGLGGILTNSLLILLTVIFILLEASSFQQKVGTVSGDPKGTLSQVKKMTDAINNYLAIKTLVSLGTGIIVAVWVWVLGIDYPVIWGLLAFLLNFIPNLGSIIAAVPPVLLGYIQFGIGRALLVAAGFAVVNLLFGNVVEPKLMGRKLGLSTLVVFLSLIFWGWVWGPVGMLLSVPMTMVVKIALESSPSTHWISVLLDSEVSTQLVGNRTQESRSDSSSKTESSGSVSLHS
jgi:AI-2 transport protein TqsA